MPQPNLLCFEKLRVGQTFWPACSCMKGAFIFSKVSESEGKVTAVIKGKASPEYVGSVEVFAPSEEVLIPMDDVVSYASQ